MPQSSALAPAPVATSQPGSGTDRGHRHGHAPAAPAASPSGPSPVQATADVINLIVLMNGTRSIIEMGCTDGPLATMLSAPSYTGVALNSATLQACAQRHGTAEGLRFVSRAGLGHEQADLCLSLDVIPHLADDATCEHYLHAVFNASRKLVLIRAGNPPEACASPNGRLHHRPVIRWVEKHRPDFVLLGGSDSTMPTSPAPAPAASPGETAAQFMLFQRTDSAPMRG